MSNPWTPQPNDEEDDVLFSSGGSDEAWRGDLHLEDDESWRTDVGDESTGFYDDFEDEAGVVETEEDWGAEEEAADWPEWLSDPEYWLYEDRDEGEAA
ncbi:MAG TPA: hypothetical protein VK845_13210 [Gemmatimonadales bacterium]|nr:hypothetical protein [Gemmatimonadales bacterium]